MLECDVIGIGANAYLVLDPGDIRLPRDGVALDRAMLSNGSKYYWGRAFDGRVPWSNYPSTMADPSHYPEACVLIDDLERIRDAIILLGDYSAPQDNKVDPTAVDILQGRHGDIFVEFVRALVESGLASRRVIDARQNQQKFRISGVHWSMLRECCLKNSDGGDTKVRKFLGIIRTIPGMELG